jgi:hypothetical protein
MVKIHASPIASEAIELIGQLYGIESEIHGQFRRVFWSSSLSTQLAGFFYSLTSQTSVVFEDVAACHCCAACSV